MVKTTITTLFPEYTEGEVYLTVIMEGNQCLSIDNYKFSTSNNSSRNQWFYNLLRKTHEAYVA